ncbi:hypothetical protein MJT46_018000 [Ovis ammon polii x Ovis aries]|nr:hypothetical protein MJT46_018000 [Ovis ammon polii x Ovis aries]
MRLQGTRGPTPVQMEPRTQLFQELGARAMFYKPQEPGFYSVAAPAGPGCGHPSRGSPEGPVCHPREHYLTLWNRKGFVCLALRHGASLVPVYSFGENDIFRVKAFAPDSWQHHLEEVPGHFSLHLLPRLFSAKSWGLVPLARPITTVAQRSCDLSGINISGVRGSCMTLEASSDGATSEVSKPEKDMEPDAEALESENRVLRRAPWAGHRSGLAPRGNDDGVLSFPVGEQPPYTHTQWPRSQIERESVHEIDAGETALAEGLRKHFCSQLVRDSTRGIKVARLTRDNQLGPQGLKKFRLITKQNKGARRAGPGARLSALPPPRASGVFSQLPGEAVWKAGGDLARLPPAVALLAARQEKPSQEWPPYWPSETARARAVLTLCTRPFRIPLRGDSTWRYLGIDAFSSDGAQRQSQLLWHLQLQSPFQPQHRSLGARAGQGYTEQYLLEADN